MADTAEQTELNVSEKVEWKSLFLSRADDSDEAFRSMRMCIAQKEDTIETIAERYNLHPNELSLHNRLQDQKVEEGQIIYIPKS